MKPLTILLLLTISMQLSAQKAEKKTGKETFVRIFDEKGKKSYTGFLTQTTDNSIFIFQKNKSVEVPVSKITTIKLRRSFGHTVLITSLIGGAAFAIIGAATAEPDALIFGYTAGEGIAAGLLLGIPAGAAVGSIIAGTRNRPIFTINQNQEDWQKARQVLDSYLNNQ
ncbi:MAG: hypothetical protein ABIP79_08215 [Chitinophagaceae bacterium]